MRREDYVVHVDSVPEEFLHFLPNRELSTLLVKLSVEVWEVIRRSVNHITRAVRLHGYRVMKPVGTIWKISIS